MEAIKTDKLTKKYKNLTAVDSLDLLVEQGELFALLGVNGAGKTTTIKMLSCLTKPTGGDAYLNPEFLITAAKTRLGILSGDPAQESYSILRTEVYLADGETVFR